MTPLDRDILTLTALRGTAPVCAWSLAIHARRQALEYIGRKTQHWSSVRLWALFAEPQYRALEAQVYEAEARSDEAATKAACKAWWTYILAYGEERKAA